MVPTRYAHSYGSPTAKIVALTVAPKHRELLRRPRDFTVEPFGYRACSPDIDGDNQVLPVDRLILNTAWRWVFVIANAVINWHGGTRDAQHVVTDS